MSKANTTSHKRTMNAVTWRKTLHDRAEHLETEAQLTRLATLAETPVDGMALVLDVALAAMHRKAAQHVRSRGHTQPPSPPPVSKFLTNFIGALRDKVTSVRDRLPEAERARLVAIAPGFEASLVANDKDTIEALVEMMKYPADIVALWIRTHLDAIEARFAS